METRQNSNHTKLLAVLSVALLAIWAYCDSNWLMILRLRPDQSQKDYRDKKLELNRQVKDFEDKYLSEFSALENFTIRPKELEPKVVSIDGITTTVTDVKWLAYYKNKAGTIEAYNEGLNKLSADFQRLEGQYPDSSFLLAKRAALKLEKIFIPEVECRLHLDVRREWKQSPPVEMPSRAELNDCFEAFERVLAQPVFAICTESMGNVLLERLTKDIEKPDLPELLLQVGVVSSQWGYAPRLLRKIAALLVTLADQFVDRSAFEEAEEALRLAQRLGLRWGRDSADLLDMLIAHAVLVDVGEGFKRLAFKQQDSQMFQYVDTAVAKQKQIFEESQISTWNNLRLGTIDYFLAPAGGWAGHDIAVNRAMDYAIWESWSFLVACGLSFVLTVIAGVLLLRVRGGDDKSDSYVWSLIDSLRTAIPCAGVTSVVLILFARFHPLTGFGIHNSDVISGLPGVLIALSVVIPVTALLIHSIVIRFAAARRLGRREVLSRSGRFAVGGSLLSVYLMSSWSSPVASNTFILLVGIGLCGVSCASGLYAFASELDDGSRLELRRLELRGRIGSFLVATLVFGAIYLAMVRPRRIDLTTRYRNQVFKLSTAEAKSWGEGKLRSFFELSLVDLQRKKTKSDDR